MNRLEETKTITSKLDTHLNNEDQEDIQIKIEQLITQWLDSFERSIFDGKTLDELLQSDLL